MYIGVTTKTLEKRFAAHLSCARNGAKQHLYSAMKFYGAGNFEIEAIDTAETKEEMFLKEQYWIDKLDTYMNGYNETIGGQGSPGAYPDKDTRKKLTERPIRTGWKHTENAKNKISLKAMGNQRCIGRTISDQHKAKLAETGKRTMAENNPMNNETSRAKVAASKIGLKRQYRPDGTFVMVRSNGN